jgi:hypothetical protein
MLSCLTTPPTCQRCLSWSTSSYLRTLLTSLPYRLCDVGEMTLLSSWWLVIADTLTVSRDFGDLGVSEAGFWLGLNALFWLSSSPGSLWERDSGDLNDWCDVCDFRDCSADYLLGPMPDVNVPVTG